LPTRLLPLLAASLLLLTGCGEKPPPLVRVTGKVVLKDKPLTAGSVHFHPDAANGYQKDTPSSLLQEDGSFAVKTFPFDEGVPPGTYRVTLSKDLAGRIKKPEYGDPVKTPWTVQVPDAGLTNKVLEVK
jgi:hypothetical protein